MKTRNLFLAALATLIAILILLIVMKLTSGVEKPEQRKTSENADVQKNALPKTTKTPAKITPNPAVLTTNDSSTFERDAKIQRLIDELSRLNAKQAMIAQTEGIIRELCDSGDAVIPAIKKLLSSNANTSVKSAAARVLAQIGSAESVETLVNFIDSESDPACKDLYVRSIQAVDKADASPSLIRALESSKDVYLSSEVRQAIARTGTEETVKQLVDACHGQNEMNAQMSNLLEALSIIRQPEAIPSLSNTAANDQNPQIRKSALLALAGMGYPNATLALADLYRSEQNTDRKPLILDAISRINSKDSLDCLHEIYNNKGNPADMRNAAARAIFTIKNGVPPAE